MTRPQPRSSIDAAYVPNWAIPESQVAVYVMTFAGIGPILPPVIPALPRSPPPLKPHHKSRTTRPLGDHHGRPDRGTIDPGVARADLPRGDRPAPAGHRPGPLRALPPPPAGVGRAGPRINSDGPTRQSPTTRFATPFAERTHAITCCRWTICNAPASHS